MCLVLAAPAWCQHAMQNALPVKSSMLLPAGGSHDCTVCCERFASRPAKHVSQEVILPSFWRCWSTAQVTVSADSDTADVTQAALYMVCSHCGIVTMHEKPQQCQYNHLVLSGVTDHLVCAYWLALSLLLFTVLPGSAVTWSKNSTPSLVLTALRWTSLEQSTTCRLT